MARTKSCQSQKKSETPSLSPTWAAGAQVLGLSSAALSGASAGSWTRSRGAGFHTATLTQDAGVVSKQPHPLSPPPCQPQLSNFLNTPLARGNPTLLQLQLQLLPSNSGTLICFAWIFIFPSRVLIQTIQMPSPRVGKRCIFLKSLLIHRLFRHLKAVNLKN